MAASGHTVAVVGAAPATLSTSTVIVGAAADNAVILVGVGIYHALSKD